MSRNALVTGLLTALVITASLAAVDGVVLKRVAKVGDSLSSKQTLTFELGDEKLIVNSKVTEKVVKADKGEIKTEIVHRTLTINTGGNDTEVNMDDKSETTVREDGSIVEMSGDEISGLDYRISYLSTVVFSDKPVKKGDTWTKTYKADSKLETVAAETKYEYLGDDKVGSIDCAKIKITGKESEGEHPMTSDATVWVNLKTGEEVKAEGSMTNVELDDEFVSVKFLSEVEP